jgi:CheY-like chemotaxis protein
MSIRTPSKVILLANDIPDHVAEYRRALSDHGYQVHVARTGEDALRVARDKMPDCTVVDLRMPDMSGWELCREITKEHEHRNMPVVVLTPNVSKTCAAESRKAGCHAWLAHPTVAEDLVRLVARVLDLEQASPATADEALIGVQHCPACESERVRATLRVSPVQYYSCTDCSFSWRVDAQIR